MSGGMKSYKHKNISMMKVVSVVMHVVSRYLLKAL